MTLLSIVQDVTSEVGINTPTTVINNTDPEVEKLLRLLNKAGTSLMKEVAWEALRKELTFTSVGTEVQTSILPSDFDRIVPETFWDRTDKNLIVGPVTSVEWTSLKANNYADTSRRRYALRGGTVIIQPTMPAGNTLAFEYVSNEWVTDTTGATGKTAFAVDTDIGVLDEELLTRALKYMFLEGEGLPSGMAERDFIKYSKQLTKNDQPRSRILLSGDIFGGGRHFGGAPASHGDSSVI